MQIPPCVDTEVTLLPFLIRNADLFKMLPARSVQALRLSSKELCGLIHDCTSSVQLRQGSDVRLLLHHSWLHLTTLKLSSAQMCEQSVTHLVKGELPRLHTLDLSKNKLQPSAFRQLASGNWQLLSLLKLEGSLLHMAPLAIQQSCQFLATSNWPSLTALDISHNAVEAIALAEIVQANWPKLQSLNLSCKGSGAGLMAKIAKSVWTAMQHLNLTGLAFGVEDAKQLGQLRWLQLKRLELSGCFQLMDEDSCISAMRHLSHGVWPELQVLDVSYSCLSTDGIAELVKGQWPALQTLIISHSRRGYSPSGNMVQALAAAPWTALQDISLDFTKLAGQEVSSLGDLSWTHITRLSLRDCFHEDDGSDTQDQAVTADSMHAFIASNWPQLEDLDVSDNQMGASVICQLTKHLSPSTTLAKISLGGNSFSYLSGLGMNTLEHAPLSKWQHLTTMDLQRSHLSPEEVERLLQSAPRSLYTLYITCRVEQRTVAARPSQQHWPCNTFLNMEVAIWPNFSEVLCSMSAGFWPVTNAMLYLARDCSVSVEEVEEFIKWDLWGLDKLHLCRNRLGKPSQMPGMAHVLSRGQWPKLRTIVLSDNVIDDVFVNTLIDGKWPLLEHVDLCGNNIGEDGVRQLACASWPLVTDLDLRSNCVSNALKTCVASLLHARWPGIALKL